MDLEGWGASSTSQLSLKAFSWSLPKPTAKGRQRSELSRRRGWVWVPKTSTCLERVCFLRLRPQWSARMGSVYVGSRTTLKVCKKLPEFGGSVLVYPKYSFPFMV